MTDREQIERELDEPLVPLPRHIINGWRDPEILRLRKEGLTLRAIAERFGMSHEGVRGRLRRMGHD